QDGNCGANCPVVVLQIAVAAVFSFDLPALGICGDRHSDWCLAWGPPIVGIKLTGPNGDKNLSFKRVAQLRHCNSLPTRCSAPGGKLAAQSSTLVGAGQLIG